VWWYAQLLVWKGKTIQISPTTKAETYDEWANHIDEGDLYVRFMNDVWERIEVKEVRRPFCSRETWPFPDFIVNAKSTHDRSNPKPLTYVVISPDREGLAYVHVKETFGHWYVENRKCGQYKDYYRDFYIIDLEHVIWKVPGD
jgi:hypothetical protein